MTRCSTSLALCYVWAMRWRSLLPLVYIFLINDLAGGLGLPHLMPQVRAISVYLAVALIVGFGLSLVLQAVLVIHWPRTLGPPLVEGRPNG